MFCGVRPPSGSAVKVWTAAKTSGCCPASPQAPRSRNWFSQEEVPAMNDSSETTQLLLNLG